VTAVILLPITVISWPFLAQIYIKIYRNAENFGEK
jgi:hypothetical protein